MNYRKKGTSYGSIFTQKQSQESTYTHQSAHKSYTTIQTMKPRTVILTNPYPTCQTSPAIPVDCWWVLTVDDPAGTVVGWSPAVASDSWSWPVDSSASAHFEWHTPVKTHGKGIANK